jgi:predicted ArsR family transcriptional regulator
MEQHYGLLASRLREELHGTTGHDRLERVARILGEAGYMASWQSADGSIRLTEHNCAIKAVAERFPQICELEERFLREVLVAGVERHSHILTGCQACEYSIHFPERGPEGDPASPGVTRNDEK